MTDKRNTDLLDIATSPSNPPYTYLLGERFETVARGHKDSIAIVDGERRVSYFELLLRADALASELEARGIGPRDLVAIALPRSAELVVAVVGVVRAGAAYVPIDLNQPEERRALILSDARPKAIVTEDLRVNGILPRINVLRLPQNVSGRITRRPASDAEDPVYVIYTSGSTGQPKGVVVSQHNAARLFTSTEPLFDFGTNDVWTLFHSIGFDVSVWELWGALLHGGCLVVVPALTARSADAFHALVMRERVSVLCQTPSAFRAFDAADALAGSPDNHLKHIIFAGEALDPLRLKRWIESHGDEKPRLVNMYGTTETTVHATHRRMLATDAGRSGRSFIGRPLADLRIDLMGSDGRPVATGEVGEIFVGGAGVSTGYLGRPELSAERFIPDPRGQHPNARLYRTGDLGRRMPDGDLEYLGRFDDQVKQRGFRIELGEIEVALCKAASVRDAVVALRNSPGKEPQLIAYVVPIDDKPLDVSLLREHVAHYLPEYMVPAAYVRIKYVPRTTSDKIDRTALPPPTAADYASASAGAAPRDALELAVAQIFADALDTTITAREANFFRLGGDSLLAMRVVCLCQERLDVDVPISSIFENPTVAALANLVQQEKHLGRGAKRVAKVPRGSAIALTPHQYALWLDLKIRRDANAYNEALAFRVTARLEPMRLARALVRLAETHEVLRARLIEVDGEPQLVFDRKASAIEFEFLGPDVPSTVQELTEATHRPFKLNEGPLWRAMLRIEPTGGSVILLVVHHLILDAASEKILLGDLIANYSDTNSLSARPQAYDFADLAAYEHACLLSERESLESFWANNLAAAEPAFTLPAPSVPCAPEAANTACTSRREIERSLARRVHDLAASWGSTPFHLYFTAYLAVLRAYAATDDLVIGSPVSLRDTPAAAGVVGYLLNPVAIRIQLAGNCSFRQTVNDVALRWQEALAHSRLPLDLALKSAKGAQRRGIGSSIQTFFSFVQDPSESILLDGCPLQRVHLCPAHVKFDLLLVVEEGHAHTSLLLDFRRKTFDPEMADRFLHHFEVLLFAATENPELPLAKLPLADRAELAQLREWGSRSVPYPRESTVTDIFEQVVRERRGLTALVAGQDRISYEDLEARANAVATLLRRSGVSKGDRIPLLLPRGILFITCALAAMKCGAAYVPLDPSYPSERLRQMLEGLEVRIGLASPRLSAGNSSADWLDPDLAKDLSSLPSPPLQVSAEDPAYVMFTSGSTGRPKGVEVPHRGIVRLVFGQDFARIGPDETWLHMAPTSFDASTLEIWAPLLHGGRCVVLQEEKFPTPRLLDEVIRLERVTSAWITASLFNLYIDEEPECLSGLEQLLIGGEALSPSHVRRALDRLPGVQIVNGYGPTENTTFTCCHVIQSADVDPGHTIPIGRPIANTTVHVLTSDGIHAPVGVPGELFAGGDGVALGYVGQPARTKQSFLPDTFSDLPGARLYRSGDRVRWRPNGELEFLGRFDNQVKIHGYRIEPDEIATCLAEQESVSEAVVFSQQTAMGASQLVACVVPRSTDLSGLELQKLLVKYTSERLPPYMVPTAFRFLRELPLQPNGKIDYAVLQGARRDFGSRAEGLLGPIESRVLAIFRDFLCHENLGPEDDFFEAGGDSLLAIRLLISLETEFGRDLKTEIMEQGCTARRLAGVLENSSRLGATYPAGVVGLRQGTADRPLFCLPGMPGSAFTFRTLATKLQTSRTIIAIEFQGLEIELSVFDSIRSTARAVIEGIRKVQPVGPYALLGYSFGGNIAIEVARELIADGEEVELAMILDAHAPGSMRTPSGLRKINAYLRIMRRQTPQENYTYMLDRIHQRLFRRRQKPLATDPTPALQGTEIERRIAEITERSIRALGAHRPEMFPGRIVLVRATELDDWSEVADPSGTCAWNAICRGGVDVIPIACGHLDIFNEPHITRLARDINGVLNALDQRHATKSGQLGESR